MKELRNEYTAYQYLIGVVDKNEKLSPEHAIVWVNKGRHVIITTQKGETYYCLFKRDWFNTFAKQFELFISEFPEHNDVAESINLNCFEQAEQVGASALLFIHADRNIYKAHTAFVRKFCIEQHKLVRTQQKANVYMKGNYSEQKEATHEKTVSIPKSLLANYEFF